MKDLNALASTIVIAVFDVDGIFTDGQLIYNGDGSESKAFSVQDGLGIKLLKQAGISAAIITGRTSEAVKNRAQNIGIDYLYQGRDDKLVALKELLNDLELNQQQVAYMGDDLPDLSAIQFANIGASVVNADPFVKKHADWVSERKGGFGAVREFAEALLSAQGKLEEIQSKYLYQPDS